ncbi:ankyrin repeat domain-containing protein [Cellulophaga fucicola]|uniref:Ankyrin repeat-containing protein n=1 Tax=Cellulophaga fucicola TaxID=76595 RepID=A0A1K1QQB3_9FLAO|nr:ankyrin repeat domain-containing protein [Cellulophaga fucicola]SFW62146.1 Ankyrin repeat-containing protein [Cellulophaga fucicola]
MKTLFFTILLIISTYASAQEISEDLKNVLQNDNVTELKKHLTAKDLDKCYKLDDTEYSLLTLSIKLNAKSCFAELVEQNASVEKTCNNKTPFMYTAKYNRLTMAKALVKAGVQIRVRNSDKQSALDFAKKYESKEIIEYIKSFNQ